MTIVIIGLIFVTEKLVILYTNDIAEVTYPRPATWINPNFPPELGGLPSLKYLLSVERRKAQKDGYPLLLLDAGNFSAPGRYGEPPHMMLKIFGELNYDVVNIGVYDLPWIAYLPDNPTFISANVEGYNKPYVILEKDDITIGVVGVVTQYLAPALAWEYATKIKVHNPIESVSRVVQHIRDSVDVLIVLSSLGFHNDVKLVEQVRGIDILVGGYEGRGLREPFEDSLSHTIIVHTYGELSGVGKLVVYLDGNHNIVGYDGTTLTLFREAYPGVK